MEGFLIRVPIEACFPDSRPAWKQQASDKLPAHTRVLYYVVEEGYLRGYKSPDSLDDPVESFQLTSHRVEVNAMYSLNIFELKARLAVMPPSHQFEEDTSSSDSSDDDSDVKAPTTEPYIPRIKVDSSPGVVSGSYHVVFFAATKELVKKWSVKLLNWNRYVFSAGDDLDAVELEQSKLEIIQALHAVNSADRFLRPIELKADTVRETLVQFSIPAPIEPLTPTETTTGTSEIVKPSDQSTQPWWVVPFGRSRKISSYTLRH
ncbi:hypothetical protein P3T76_003342 [Phytophthora citrophthora]|uniref:PH domain-containing protein n=1 Tax=Phytophthora citrophthora TaxID=4793 RepID=A0AAD9GUE7_9STRA|nr:hypothetical protein P3T76_003342 [Phytophthora citrophthora]